MSEPVSEVKIGKRTFISAALILFLLMIASGILTIAIPAGNYDRVMTNGREMINPDSFHYTANAGYPVWRWFTAPVEVLGSDDGPMIIVITFFILAIGGSFAILERSGVLKTVISKIVNRFKNRKYILLSVIVLFFMLLGSVLGTFEENIALVPIVIALAHLLGWDSLVGLGMSILASCFGFAAAITNPFSISITQKISGLPMYSGSGFRIVIFLVIYAILCLFLIRYAKKIEKNPQASIVFEEDRGVRARYINNNELTGDMVDGNQTTNAGANQRSMVFFAVSLFLILAVMLSSSFINGMSDLVMPLIGIMFLAGSIISSTTAGLKIKDGLGALLKGVSGMAPGIILILMAMSVKFIINQGGIMDTILHYAASAISKTSPYGSIFLVYILILVMELFIGSSSAKAFLLMPIIAPLSDLVGITRQTSVVAFSFGDGFSNVLYPTNPVLLICLGLTVVSYPKWFKWTIKLQLTVFAITCAFLAIAVAIKLGPF